MKSSNYSKLNPKVKETFIDLGGATKVDEDLDHLKSILMKETGSVVVFCQSKQRMDKVCEFLRDENIKSLPFTDDSKKMSI